MKKKRSTFSALGYLIFFVTVAAIITCAVLIYSFLAERAGKLTIAVVMLIVVVVLAGVCTLIDVIRRKYMVERPVREILRATERIAAGDFKVRLTARHGYERYDEYDEIYENINRMAAELSRNEVLKTDFISNVSHEIKTPLSVISNHATLLQDETLTEEERAEYTKALLAASKRLTDLVTDILKLNKLENQVIPEQKTTLHLGDFLGEIVLGFEDLIEGKNIELECDIDDVTFSADRTYLEIISNNLLSNAVKFTPEGGKISVSLKESEKDVVLKVSDTGCGMTPEVGARIFDKFYQGDTSHRQQGNGLGLALVKKVIDLMGGSIRVESELGKGSTFWVTLKK